MNFYRVKISGKSYDRIPQSIEDVTMRRFLAFRNVPIKEEQPLVQWLLDSTEDLADTAKTEREIQNLFSLTDDTVESIYMFMGNGPQQNEKLKSVDILGDTLNLEKLVYSSLPYWPYVVTKKLVENEFKKAEKENRDFDLTDKYPEIVAHYLYRAATDRVYNETDAENFAEVILDLPFTQVIRLGNFFLNKQKSIAKLKRKK